MPDRNATDLRLGGDAHPPDEPTPDEHGDRVAVAPDGGAGGWEAFDDPDAPTDRSPADWQYDPDQLAGKTRAELEELLQDWDQLPTTTEGGTRWFRPGSKGSDSVRWMPGNPDDPDPVKREPYVRASLHGVKYGPYPAG